MISSEPCRFLAAMVIVFLAGCNTMPNRDTSEVEQLEIGHVPQGIAVSGNPENPVLLILHGGGLPLPGVASKSRYPFLQKHFLLIFWDQRGTGRSTHESLNTDNMRIENFINDVEEMTQYIKAHYSKEKIYLLGHSWGSMLGLASVMRKPDNYYGYVGVSQQINLSQSDDLVFAELSRYADKASLSKKLSLLGSPPYESVSDWLALREMVARNGGLVSGQGEIGMFGMLRRMFGSFMFNRDYDRFEVFRIQRNMNFVMEHTYRDMMAFDLSGLASLEIPVLLIHGRHDLNSHPQIAKDWLAQLRAPSKKWVELEHSAHMPMWEEPSTFQRQVIKILQP